MQIVALVITILKGHALTCLFASSCNVFVPLVLFSTLLGFPDFCFPFGGTCGKLWFCAFPAFLRNSRCADFLQFREILVRVGSCSVVGVLAVWIQKKKSQGNK